MEDDVEHLGNDLGIGDESVSSKSSDEETQDTSQSSKEAGASTASTPEKDRFSINPRKGSKNYFMARYPRVVKDFLRLMKPYFYLNRFASIMPLIHIRKMILMQSLSW